MSKYESYSLLAAGSSFPKSLAQLHDPPDQLYVAGQGFSQLLASPRLAVVGSRSATTYGRQITEQLVTTCAAAGITIISGLAFGIDSVAHKTALQAGGKTIAVLPSSLGKVYPASHQRLADRIIEQGGALVSEYGAGVAPMKHQFIARNRIIAGLSQAVLVTEAAHNSGSLHTANFCLDMGRQVMAVPGNISSPTSVGCNRLLRVGALPVLEAKDILDFFEIKGSARASPVGKNAAEQTILDLLDQGVSKGNALLTGSLLEVPLYHQTMTMLELSGRIKALGGDSWQLRYS